MPYEQGIHLKSREAHDIDLHVYIPCGVCNEGVESLNGCKSHNARDDVIKLKVRGIPWSRRNQIISQSLAWDSDGKSHWDGDYYARECLKQVIVEAPWCITDDKFLLQVGDDLGAALETLVPKAFNASKTQSPAQIKKEL